jgi:hypothetical protein
VAPRPVNPARHASSAPICVRLPSSGGPSWTGWAIAEADPGSDTRVTVTRRSSHTWATPLCPRAPVPDSAASPSINSSTGPVSDLGTSTATAPMLANATSPSLATRACTSTPAERSTISGTPARAPSS